MSYETITPAIDAHLRRLARKYDYILRKSRWRLHSIDNLGGYMIVDRVTNLCVAGERFDLAPSYVEAWLTQD